MTRLKRPLSLLLPLALLAGCDVELSGRTGGPVMNDAQQAADAFTPDATAADSAGSAGEVMQPGTDENQVPAPADRTTNDARAQPPVGQESGSHVGEKTKEILNAKEVTKDPNWTVVASDPTQVKAYSFAGTAYNRAAALVGTANLEQWLKQEQALNGAWPTYQQLLDYIAQNPVDMPALREYQHYGYDESSGQVVILENAQEKAARRNELGIDE